MSDRMPDAIDPGRLVALHDRLAAAYGTPVLIPDNDPLGGLVGTILSQSTSDINSGRAYLDLRAAFPDWEAVRDAPVGAVTAAILRGGLAHIKAVRIQAALRALTTMLPSGAGDLATRTRVWLQDLPLATARQELTTLPGVGPKTAACVLLFSLGRPSMPVDTHVYRVSQRLGLIGPRVNPTRAHVLYDAATPPDLVYPLHILLITHGRRTCRAHSPRCPICPLLDMCPYGQDVATTIIEK